MAPEAFTVLNVLALAGPAGLVAPVPGFATPAATVTRLAVGDRTAADLTPIATGRYACLALMAFLLALIVSCEGGGGGAARHGS